MDILNHLIYERPALLFRYIAYAIIILISIIIFAVKWNKSRIITKEKKKIPKEQRTYGVTIYLGIDNKIRFVPRVENELGLFVRIPEVIEIPFENDVDKIGTAYCEARENSLRHFGENNDIDKAPHEYKYFKNFKSKKGFNSSHCCIASTKIDMIAFTYLPWQKSENVFCLFVNDAECRKIIDKDSNARKIGETILEILQMAKSSYPDNEILSDDYNSSVIDSWQVQNHL